VYCLGGKAVRIMQYEPRNALTYVSNWWVDKKISKR
jgi:hypothetical protein